MSSKQKLELTWIGKEDRPKLEPRILVEVPEKSYRAKEKHGENDIFDNMLIHGDNLLALKALEQEFTGKVKCIYIDPPYNTGSAFTHYDDCLEHSIWLGLMRERLIILQNLLSVSGVIFISIDDDEYHYLKVLCDEIFGRDNYCGSFIWERKKKPSFLSNMGIVTEYVLAYAKDKTNSPPFIYGRTTVGKKYPLNNAGNGLRTISFPPQSVHFGLVDQTVPAQDMSGGNIITRLLNDVVIENGMNANAFSLEGEWRYSQGKINNILAAGESIVISRIPFRPNHIKTGGKPKKMKNLLSIAHYEMATNEDATKESEALFGTNNSFENPKPEKLISTLISAVSEPGDLVLDSFLGSGTTAAVAHKLGMRWIGIELGDHCYTHCIPRLQKVVDGTDQGGISEVVDWQGGGGFRFYELGESVIDVDDWGQKVINDKFTPDMLIEAVCKVEGFTYAPSKEEYFIHGYSSEQSFIYVTANYVKADVLHSLSEQLGPKRFLTVYCTGFDEVSELDNIIVKKIPESILKKFEIGRDNYDLNVQAAAEEDAR